MEGYILRDGKEQLTLSTAAADKLLQSGQGDAALLYLALCRFGRGVTPEELERLSGAVSWVDVCVEMPPANEQKG